MAYTAHYVSPLGDILLAADDLGLTGLWFVGQKHFPAFSHQEDTDLPIFDRARQWLDIYFSGKQPDFMPPVHLIGTDFQVSVWQALSAIPYGKTVTYGQIAKKLYSGAQAVGSAVGRNPISILIPCHRVVGSNGSLTGYAGGLDRKMALLALESV